MDIREASKYRANENLLPAPQISVESPVQAELQSVCVAFVPPFAIESPHPVNIARERDAAMERD